MTFLISFSQQNQSTEDALKIVLQNAVMLSFTDNVYSTKYLVFLWTSTIGAILIHVQYHFMKLLNHHLIVLKANTFLRRILW